MAEFTGRFIGVNIDWKTGERQVLFSVNEQAAVENIASLDGIEKLRIEAKKYRQKRSLDANAYCWVLCTKIAEEIKSSKDEVYEEMLQKYGGIYQDEDGYITVTVRKDVDMTKIQGHWKFYKSNGKFSSYLMIKGSSQYDTKEMSNFIDCVVQEAKELGIETATPDEIERMKAMWKA